MIRNFIKMIFDLFLSLIIIVILSPIFILLFLLIPLLSQGPPIYKQERLGKNGKPFKIYKFRSMIINAESNTGPVFAIKNDRRITSLGRFLRQTHLDELPQFFNVIKGDMSLVGPRPERQHFITQFESNVIGFRDRLTVRPGITGLAQIKERYDVGPEKKLAYDLQYIKHQSLRLDLIILTRTFILILTKKIISLDKNASLIQPEERNSINDEIIEVFNN